MARTRLDAFLTAQKLTTVRVATAARMSRKHVGNVRGGKAEPGLKCIVAIVHACARLTRNRNLRAEDLFEIEQRKAS